MAQSPQSTQLTPQLLLQDPLLADSLKCCHMTLTLASPGKISRGYFYSVSPHGGVIILVVLDESCTKIEHLNHVWPHAITSITVDRDNVISDDLLKRLVELSNPKKETNLPPDAIIARRNKVLDGLKSANLPHEVDEVTGVIIVADTVLIDPPYGQSDVTGRNSLVMKNIKDLIAECGIEKN